MKNLELNLDTILAWVTAYSIRILGALVIFMVGRWVAHRFADLMKKLMLKSRVEETLVHFLGNLAYYAMLAVVIIAALNNLGVNTASFLTIVGAAGLAVGLALKDSLSNFAAGVMIVLFKPFKIGDAISAAGITAKVEKISIFNTHFCTPDNQLIIVPNSKIISDTITNINAKETRRIDLVIGISYGDDAGRAKEVLGRIIAAESRVLPSPAVTIAVAELADSSVNLVCQPWVKTTDYWDVRFALIENIKKTFDAEGINIPFPQRDVHVFMEKQGDVS